MEKLNATIAQVAYVLDALRQYRNILRAGDCNNCCREECQWKPKPGEMVRYNCPHYIGSLDGYDSGEIYWIK